MTLVETCELSWHHFAGVFILNAVYASLPTPPFSATDKESVATHINTSGSRHCVVMWQEAPCSLPPLAATGAYRNHFATHDSARCFAWPRHKRGLLRMFCPLHGL